MELKIKKENLLIFLLITIFVLLVAYFLIVEFITANRIVLPILISSIVATVIYFILNIFNHDKFVSKIYLVSILVHFCFILFWQILKYHILNLPLPTASNFSAYISDVDGIQYHYIGSYIADNFNLNIFIDSNLTYGWYQDVYLGDDEHPLWMS